MEMEDEDETENQDGTKRSMRRTKDAEGRVHKCSFCHKTYLSYPALYTHLKNKHVGPDGYPVATISAGRGRGRPKKTMGPTGFFNPTFAQTTYRHFETTLGESYFQTPDRQGGPVFPDSGFAEVYAEIFIKKFEDTKDGDDSDDDGDGSNGG